MTKFFFVFNKLFLISSALSLKRCKRKEKKRYIYFEKDSLGWFDSAIWCWLISGFVNKNAQIKIFIIKHSKFRFVFWCSRFFNEVFGPHSRLDLYKMNQNLIFFIKSLKIQIVDIVQKAFNIFSILFFFSTQWIKNTNHSSYFYFSKSFWNLSNIQGFESLKKSSEFMQPTKNENVNTQSSKIFIILELKNRKHLCFYR